MQIELKQKCARDVAVICITISSLVLAFGKIRSADRRENPSCFCSHACVCVPWAFDYSAPRTWSSVHSEDVIVVSQAAGRRTERKGAENQEGVRSPISERRLIAPSLLFLFYLPFCSGSPLPGFEIMSRWRYLIAARGGLRAAAHRFRCQTRLLFYAVIFAPVHLGFTVVFVFSRFYHVPLRFLSTKIFLLLRLGRRGCRTDWKWT